MGELPYLYREVDGAPIVWWEPLDLASEVEAWLVPAAGNAMCVDQLINFVRALGPDEQVRVGLPWVAKLVVADKGRSASPSSSRPDDSLASRGPSPMFPARWSRNSGQRAYRNEKKASRAGR